MQVRQRELVRDEETAAPIVVPPPSPVTARRLADALDRVLDEGITDFGVRTRGDRRRVAALHAGFAAGEALLRRFRARGRRGAPSTGERMRTLLRVGRHLLFWAAATGREDRSAETRAAFEALRVAVRAAGGGVLAAASDPSLMQCERCGARGADLDDQAAMPARTRALCVACAAHARRAGRGTDRDD